MKDELSRRDALRAIGAGIPAVGVAPGMGAPSGAAAETPSQASQPDWQGRALVVYTRSLGPSMPIILTECRFESVGGRLFLAGVDQSCRRALREWSEGMPRWVAWEIVEGYLVFDSLDEYYSRLKGPGSNKDS